MMYITFNFPYKGDGEGGVFEERLSYENIVDLVEDLHFYVDSGLTNIRVEIGGMIFRPAKLQAGGLDIKPLGPA